MQLTIWQEDRACVQLRRVSKSVLKEPASSSEHFFLFYLPFPQAGVVLSGPPRGSSVTHLYLTLDNDPLLLPAHCSVRSPRGEGEEPRFSPLPKNAAAQPDANSEQNRPRKPETPTRPVNGHGLGAGNTSPQTNASRAFVHMEIGGGGVGGCKTQSPVTQQVGAGPGDLHRQVLVTR